MKLACVIHRFGPQITGGSEAHCLAIATQLAAAGHDVEILTSCATDYVTWANALPEGESREGPLRIRRFPVTRPRHLNRFREISEWVFTGRATEAEQEQWFHENGPELPRLLDHLRAHGSTYDRVLFWSYRYYPTFFGLPLVADRAILVPTAEDDEIIRTATILGEFFAKPRAYLFLTPEEQDLVAAHAGGPLPPSEVVGAGLNPSPPLPPSPPASVGERGDVLLGGGGPPTPTPSPDSRRAALERSDAAGGQGALEQSDVVSSQDAALERPDAVSRQGAALERSDGASRQDAALERSDAVSRQGAALERSEGASRQGVALERSDTVSGQDAALERSDVASGQGAVLRRSDVASGQDAALERSDAVSRQGAALERSDGASRQGVALERSDTVSGQGAVLRRSDVASGQGEARGRGEAGLEQFGIRGPFVLYLGRIEKNKGCDRLIDYFLSYAGSGKPAMQLVMAGPSIMAIREHPAIRVLGFVAVEVRDRLLAEARVLVMPSPYESLSMVLLEAWRVGTPALVYGRCKPLRGQTSRADGGLIYEQREEFIEALGWFAEHPQQARAFGRQGQAYVLREYQWPVVMAKVSRILGI